MTVHRLHRVIELPVKRLDDVARENRVDTDDWLRRDDRPYVTFGDMLVAFFRRSASVIGWSLYVLGVLTAMYFAFQLRRGL